MFIKEIMFDFQVQSLYRSGVLINTARHIIRKILRHNLSPEDYKEEVHYQIKTAAFSSLPAYVYRHNVFPAACVLSWHDSYHTTLFSRTGKLRAKSWSLASQFYSVLACHAELNVFWHT